MRDISKIHMNQTTWRNTSHIPYSYSELTRTLFPVESTNNNKVTGHRVIGDGYIWEGIMNIC